MMLPPLQNFDSLQDIIDTISKILTSTNQDYQTHSADLVSKLGNVALFTDEQKAAVEQRAYKHLQNKELEQSIKLYTFLRILDPKRLTYALGLAISYSEQQYFEKALELLLEILELYSTIPFVHLLTAITFAKLGQYRNAQFHLQECIGACSDQEHELQRTATLCKDNIEVLKNLNINL